MESLKYLSKSSRTFEMSVINLLTWSAKCFLVTATVGNQMSTSRIADTKRYVPVA